MMPHTVLLELAQLELRALELRARQDPEWQRAAAIALQIVEALERGDFDATVAWARELADEWDQLYASGF